MTRAIPVILVAFLASGLLAAEEQVADNTAMTNTSYSVLPGLTEKFADISASLESSDGFVEMGTEDIGREHDWVEFYRDMGVEWPPGSSIRYVPALGKLFVRNTPENIAKLNQIMAELNIVPNQIDIEIQFVEFNLADVETLAKKGIVNATDLRELWKKGRGRLLHAPKVLTQAGEEATVKAVSEYSYPTEFGVAPIISTNAAHAAVSGVVAEPGAFETREVGVILCVLPDVSPEGNMINLCLTPEAVGEPVWKDYGLRYTDPAGKERRAPMEQPFFHTHVVSTSISVEPGHTVLFGGGTTSADPGKVVYTFVTAQLADTDGKLMATPSDVDLPDEQQEPPTGMQTRLFYVRPSFPEVIADMRYSTTEDSDDRHQVPDTELDTVELFQKMGVEWPEGSAIRHIPAIGRLIVTNTRQNLEIFEKVLAEIGVIPSQVEIEARFVEFETADINRMTAQGGTVDYDSLNQLWQKDKGKLLCAPKVVTQAGEEATVKGVTEYIFPTEFSCVASRMDSTNTAVISSPAVVPQSFETREVGVVMSVLPEVSPEGNMLQLVMAPEFVENPEWRDFGTDITDPYGNKQSLHAEQPFFFTYLACASISMNNGATMLIGGGMTGKDPTKTVYAFVTARLIDTKGNPLPVRD